MTHFPLSFMAAKHGRGEGGDAMKLLFISAAVLIAAAFPGCVSEDKGAAGAKKTVHADDPAFDPLKRPPSGPADTMKSAGITMPANIGDTVSIGVFDYAVESVSFRKTIASGAIHETAGGIFLLLTLTFANHDRQPHPVDTSLIRLTDANNMEYACSAPACDIIAMNGKNCLCSKSCRPRETIKGTMIFDVPLKEGEYRLKVSNGAWRESTREIRLTILMDSAVTH